MEPASKTARELISAIGKGQRSSLFHWFVEHHDQLVEETAGTRISWRTFLDGAIALGLTDANGAAPSLQACRKTWHRAREHVSRRRAARLQVGSSQKASAPIPRHEVRPRLAGEEVIRSSVATGTAVATEGPWEGNPAAATPALEPMPQPPVPSRIVTVGLPLEAAATSASAPSPGPAASEPEPVYTAEQIAHRDEQLAKARARCDVTDRFKNL